MDRMYDTVAMWLQWSRKLLLPSDLAVVLTAEHSTFRVCGDAVVNKPVALQSYEGVAHKIMYST